MFRICQRRGLSLLEVIIAIAILGGAMAVILELVNLGMRSAQNAQLRGQANLHCDTKMAEISAGALELKNHPPTPIAEDNDWLFFASVDESNILGLLVITMNVQQADVEDPVSVQIVRYVPDPDFDPLAEVTSE